MVGWMWGALSRRIADSSVQHRSLATTRDAFGVILGSGSGDDGTSSLIHVILLLVISGIVICSSAHVLQHKLGLTWIPEPAVSLGIGLIFGGLIRLNSDDDAQLPQELGFSGSIFFLVLLPIIIFEGGFSLKKKEFFGQLGSILCFSIIGTIVSGLSIGALLYYVGQAGWSTLLPWNEALAFGSVLATTDSLCTTQMFSGLNVDRSFLALAYGEGSVNEAVSLVMYDTFVHFIADQGQDETTTLAFTKFASLLGGSIVIGLAIGIASTWVFRIVHMDWRPRPVQALVDAIGAGCGRCCRRKDADYMEARSALLRGPKISARRLDSATIGASGMMAHQFAAAAAGLAPDFDPIAIVKSPPSLAALRVAASRLTKAEHMAAEPKPSSSVFLQTSFILAIGYISYMAAEAADMSGVVAVLFCGVSMNHFVRPLMTREGKRFSEGTIKVLSQTSDTSIFFQVGLDMGLTVGTRRGIDSRLDGALVGWVLLAIMVGRAISIIPLSAAVNYFRRTAIPWQYVFTLWHAGMRGAGTYAFMIIFPTENRDLLLDVTAVAILFSVYVLGGTTVPVLRALKVPHDAPGHGHVGKHGDVEGKGEILGHGAMHYAAEDTPRGGSKPGYALVGAAATTAGADVTEKAVVPSSLPEGMSSPPPLARARSGYSLLQPADTEVEEEEVASKAAHRSVPPQAAPSSPRLNVLSKDRIGSASSSRTLALHKGTPSTSLRSPSRTPSKRSAGMPLSSILLTGDPSAFQGQDSLSPRQSSLEASAFDGDFGAETRGSTGSKEETAESSSALVHSVTTIAVGSEGETHTYRTVMVSGARAYVPVYRQATPSERAVSAVNAFLTILRYYVSGVLRDEKLRN